MKTWIIAFFLSLGFFANAQEVISNGKVYEVKKKAIFQDGVDITSTLEKEEKDDIFKALKFQSKEIKNAEDARKKLEKAAKKATKAQKKATKELKQKQKALDKFNKASKKLKQNQEKFKKLKFRGKLSPNDEAKWIKKLEKIERKVEKLKRKM